MPRQLQKILESAAAYPTPEPELLAAFLERIGDCIMAIGDPLISTCFEETSLSVDRLTGERARTVNQLRMFAGLVREGSWIDARIDTALPDRKPVPKPDLRRMLLPLGPIAVFGASNFPLAFSVAGGDTASALAAGFIFPILNHVRKRFSQNYRRRALRSIGMERGMARSGRR